MTKKSSSVQQSVGPLPLNSRSNNFQLPVINLKRERERERETVGCTRQARVSGFSKN
jgi:hypothetical protein